MGKPAFTRAEPDARRQSLIEACARVMARGIAGASVRAIAVEAGVSPGLITHYFSSLDALIAAAYANLGDQVQAALAAAVATAGPDPFARLTAYVTASFTRPIADPALLGAWIAFWSLVTARADIAAVHDAIYAAYRRDLAALLAECGVGETAQRGAAIGIAALVDGLWLELCLSPDGFTAGEASEIVLQHLHMIVPAPPPPAS